MSVGTVTDSSTPRAAPDEWVYRQENIANHLSSTYEKDFGTTAPERSQ
jgi:hypothetical protein